MKKHLYIFTDSILKRKDNTIMVETVINDNDSETEVIDRTEFFLDKEIEIPNGDKNYIPLESIDSIFCFGTTRFNSKFIYLLSKNDILLHIYHSDCRYVGSFLPPKGNPSGSILINQMSHYLKDDLRQYIGRQLIVGQIDNILTILKYYQNRNHALNHELHYISELFEDAKIRTDIEELQGIEGAVRKCYYSCWQKIIVQPIAFTQRVKNPPDNFMNALMSYGNMVLYSVCLNEIYRTRLYPEIGFIHEPGDRKLPLSYDIADLFKPMIVDRTIFKLMNRNMISEEDGESINGSIRLTEKCKKLFIHELNCKLFTTINNSEANKNMSYKRIIRNECYKLVKHITGEELYLPFKMPW